MFCTQCGRENPQGNRFCTGCGVTLRLTSPKPVQQSLRPFALIFGGSAILVLVVLLIAVLRGREHIPPPQPPQPTRTQQPPQPKAAELTPVLQVSPSSLEFSLREGEKNPPMQTVTIANAGKGRLEWQAQTNASWLRLNRNSGVLTEGKNTQLNVSIDRSGLQILARQEAQVVITASGARGSPITIRVIVNQIRNVDPQLKRGIDIPLKWLDYIGVEDVNYQQTTLGTVFRAQRGKYVILIDFGYSFNRYQPLAELIASQGMAIVLLAENLAHIDEKEEESMLASRVYFGGYLLGIHRGGNKAFLTHVEPNAANLKVLDVVDYHAIEKDAKTWIAQAIGGTPLGNAAPALSMRDRLQYLFDGAHGLKPVYPSFRHRLLLIRTVLSEENRDYDEQALTGLLQGTRYSRRISDLRDNLKSANEFDRRRLQSQLDHLISYLNGLLRSELSRTKATIAEERHYWSKTEVEFGEYDFTASGFPLTRIWGLDVSFTPESQGYFPAFLIVDEQRAQQLIRRQRRMIECWVIWKPTLSRPPTNRIIISEFKEAFAFDEPTGLLVRLPKR